MTNVINGTNGNDSIDGTSNNDTINALEGDDWIFSSGGSDTIDGGPGWDTVFYDGWNEGVFINNSDTEVSGVAAGTVRKDPLSINTDTLIGVEVLQGSQFDDTIIGDDGSNDIFGNDGNDIIHGGGIESDGLDGFDFLDGGAGNDTITVLGAGDIVGGAGNDTFRAESYADNDLNFVVGRYSEDPAGIVANLTAVTNGGLAGGDNINGFLIADGFGDTDNVAGLHVVQGSAFNDVIYVDSTYQNSFGNWLEVRPGAGDDQIFFDDVSTARISYRRDQGPVFADMDAGIARDLNAGDSFIGNDTFVGANEFRGSRYDDEIYGNRGDDKRLRGQDGDDYIDGRAGDDRIDGENGNDTLMGGRGTDDLRGGNGDDVIYGGRDSDMLTGGSGNDEMYGGRDGDTLEGGDGNDILRGGHGDDRLFGENDDDTMFGGRGSDALSGGNGNDELRGGRDGDLLEGGDGNDILRGGEGDDLLRGDNDDDLLLGGQGNDTLLGGDGNDTLKGGKGDDELDGGIGNDILRGGDGDDLFIFSATNGHDTVEKFKAGEDSPDVLDISAWGIEDLDELEPLMDDQNGTSDTVIALDASNSITLLGVQIDDLDSDDFIFA